jgi:photosystem II stability/assembly factor-like uncharacterized protein
MNFLERLMKKNLILFIFLISTMQTGVTHAQWTQVSGLEGGIVRGFAVSTDSSGNTTLIAGTDGGIFVSSNCGDSWTRPGWYDLILALAVTVPDSSGRTRLFAGSAWGLSFSDDTGRSQKYMDAFRYPIEKPVQSLAISPRDSSGKQTLYAITISPLYSTDYGATWVYVKNDSLKYASATTIMLIPAIAGNGETRLFIGTRAHGVYRSTNNGSNWRSINAGLPMARVYCFNWTPPDTAGSMSVYVGTAGGLFRSTDFGEHWQASDAGIVHPDIRALAVVPAPDGSRASWLFAGTWGGGVFRSTDYGGSWTEAGAGMSSKTTLSFAFIPASVKTGDAKLFAGSYVGGVFRSTDYGGNWTEVNRGIALDTITAITVNEDSSRNIYAATCGGGVFRSTNEGISWTHVNNGLSDSGRVDTYVGTLAARGSNILAATEYGTFHSMNRGADWRLTPMKPGVAAFLFTDSSVFAGTNEGLFQSTDNGLNWQAPMPGMTVSYERALAANGDTLFVGSGDQGVFRSTDKGASWTEANNGIADKRIRALAVSPIPNSSGRRNIFAGSGAIYRSTNNGTSWTNVSNGLPFNVVLAFAVIRDNLFTATGWDGRVYQSTNDGASWKDISPGLSIYDGLTSFTRSDTQLFLGTERSGMWKRPIADLITDAGGQSGPLPDRVSLAQNYPNPFHSTTTIAFSLPSRAFVSLKIFDLYGRETATILAEELSAGNYARVWNAKDLPTGVYFYRLQCGSHVETKRLVFME